MTIMWDFHTFSSSLHWTSVICWVELWFQFDSVQILTACVKIYLLVFISIFIYIGFFFFPQCSLHLSPIIPTSSKPIMALYLLSYILGTLLSSHRLKLTGGTGTDLADHGTPAHTLCLAPYRFLISICWTDHAVMTMLLCLHAWGDNVCLSISHSASWVMLYNIYRITFPLIRTLQGPHISLRVRVQVLTVAYEPPGWWCRPHNPTGPTLFSLSSPVTMTSLPCQFFFFFFFSDMPGLQPLDC